jgi:hypothetical protein
MTFKITGAIFKNTAEQLKERFGARYDANKKYPTITGVFGIKEVDREALINYVSNAVANENGEILLQVSGYNNVSKAGLKYLGLTIEADWNTLQNMQNKELDSFVEATNGQVVPAFDDELL